MFEDWRTGRNWLPDTIYINRYRDASYVPMASFDEDADLTTTTVPGGQIAARHLSIWHEGRIPWRSGDRDYNGVFLGWNRAKQAEPPTYTISLPQGEASKLQLGPQSTVEISVAALAEDAPLPGAKEDEKKSDEAEEKDRPSPDFTIELLTTDGAVARVIASRIVSIPPPLTERFTKLDLLESEGYEKDWEPVFQTVRAPLTAFSSGSKAFDATKVAAIRLRFDRTPMSVICISGIGFGTRLP